MFKLFFGEFSIISIYCVYVELLSWICLQWYSIVQNNIGSSFNCKLVRVVQFEFLQKVFEIVCVFYISLIIYCNEVMFVFLIFSLYNLNNLKYDVRMMR